MSGLSHRRQVILFLCAVLVPYAILIALSIQVIGQDTELREARRSGQQRQTLARVRQELLARLEAISRDEIRRELKPGERYRHSEVVLVGWIEEERLVLPWETDSAAQRNRGLIAEPAFEAKIRGCEHAEFGSEQSRAAARCYEEAADGAGSVVQKAYARLQWARALDKAGQRKPALALFETLLAAGPEITDEDGIPLALFAADSMAQQGAPSPRIFESVNAVLSAHPWPTPASSFLASEIAGKLARRSSGTEWQKAEDLRRTVGALVRMTEQAQRLDSDLLHLGLPRRDKTGQPVWIAYGDDLWLVGTAPEENKRTPVIVVRAPDVLAPIETRLGMHFADAREPQGEPLGDPFSGLKVSIAPPPSPSLQQSFDLQRRLYYFALLLVAAATTFGGYLLWRDLRRELRLSELRAQFVSSVSHELKTPLTAIRMLAETLQMGRVPDPDIQAEYLDTITNECERLSRLVDEVLLFSKTEQGKKVYRFRPVHLEDTIMAAARALEYPLRQKGFELHVHIETGLPVVKADEDALEQAILNLLSNAMKYSGDSRDIDMALCRSNGNMVIRVSDHGVGIPPSEQSRIFDKFYRAPTRENQLIPGTGLGLTLVAQIVKAHGGKVAVKSTPGEGSAFSICLPLEGNV